MASSGRIATAATKALSGLNDCFQIVTQIVAPKELNTSSNPDCVVSYKEQVISIVASIENTAMHESKVLLCTEWLVTSNTPEGRIMIEKWGKETYRRVASICTTVFSCERFFSSPDTHLAALKFVFLLGKNSKSVEVLKCLCCILESASTFDDKDTCILTLLALKRFSQVKGTNAFVKEGLYNLLHKNSFLHSLFLRCVINSQELENSSETKFWNSEDEDGNEMIPEASLTLTKVCDLTYTPSSSMSHYFRLNRQDSS